MEKLDEGKLKMERDFRTGDELSSCGNWGRKFSNRDIENRISLIEN